MSLKFVAIFFSFILSISNILALPVNETREDNINYRLDGTIVPSLYKIKLTPYILENEVTNKERFTFEGNVEITLQVTKDKLKEIVLHTKSLNIIEDKTTLSRKGETNEVITIIKHSIDIKTDKLTLQLEKELQLKTEYVLKFEYSGKLSDNMKGFYKSFYKDKDGKEVWIASTQFQTHYARNAFPCFDEPKYKAQFKIEICRHAQLNSVSNTPLEKQSETDLDCPNRVKDIFKKTPIMSTYLVAFIVSNFNARTDKNGNFSVLARPDAYDQTLFSFEIGKSILKEFDKYFGHSYQTLGIEKMDMAAIPDFSAGAMENWGLLTYRERALLFLPGKTAIDYEQKIAATVAHEQAHMWFGDYVTCDWWSYTWLNEGFARFFQYFILIKVKPQWEMDKQFSVEQLQTAFQIDSKMESYPLSNENVQSPTDLSTMFGTISYNKGASVIKMIQHALGEENFKNALHNYLEVNKEKTSIPEKLFKELKKEWTDSETFDVFDQFLKDFTEQVGYPVVTVKLNEDGKSLHISQKRFLLSKTDGSDDSLLYTIPFSFTTNKDLDFKNTKPSKFVSKSSSETKIDLPEKVDFIIANIQQIGYYRVNYDEATWIKISKYLDSENYNKIHENNRAQIIDDLFNLARSGYLSYRFVLDIVDYLNREISYTPWVAAFNGFSFLEKYFGHEKVFAKHILRLTENVYKHLGFDEKSGEKRLDIYNRAKVLSWACKHGNEDCIEKAKKLFDTFAHNNTEIPVNIRQSIYCTGIREGNDKNFDFLWNRYVNEDVSTEAVVILYSLGCARDEKIVQKYLDYILTDDVRLQDKSAALSSLYNENRDNVQIVLDYVIKNYEKVADSLGGFSDLVSLFSSLSARFTNNDQIKQLEKFYEDNENEFREFAKRFEDAIKVAEDNLLWINSFSSDILKILEEKNIAINIKSFNMGVMILLSTVAIYWYR